MHLALAELRWEGGWWPKHGPEDLQWIGWILVGLALVLGTRLGMRYWRWLAAKTKPLRLFIAIGKACGLSLGQCWLLWRLARSRRLRTPLTLLMSRATLDHHVAAYAAGLPPYRATAIHRSFEPILRRFSPPTAA